MIVEGPDCCVRNILFQELQIKETATRVELVIFTTNLASFGFLGLIHSIILINLENKFINFIRLPSTI